MVSLAVCFLVVNSMGEARAVGFARRGPFLWRFFMSSFVLDLLNLCLFPFSCTDNLLVFVPTVSLTIVFLFGLVHLLMKGGHA